MNESFQPPFATREERIAYNEAWARDLNEKRAEWTAYGNGGTEFRCECWQADCEARIPLSADDWAEVRSSPRCFAVHPGHLAPDVEAVVEKRSHYWIVEKHGAAGEVAEELD